MKQIAKSSASPTVKKAIAKSAPDIKSYADRAAALTAAGIKRESVEIEEAVSETIVKHNDFTIEITDNPTFGDFLRAVQSIVRTDEESMQKEIVAVAEQAFAENYEEVIIEAFTRMEIEDKMAAHRKAGNTVTNDKFSTKNGQPYAEYVVTDKEGGRKKYIHHGTVRRMESMPSASKRDKE
jgi:altronate dehydratase